MVLVDDRVEMITTNAHRERRVSVQDIVLHVGMKTTLAATSINVSTGQNVTMECAHACVTRRPLMILVARQEKRVSTGPVELHVQPPVRNVRQGRLALRRLKYASLVVGRT